MRSSPNQEFSLKGFPREEFTICSSTSPCSWPKIEILLNLLNQTSAKFTNHFMISFGYFFLTRSHLKTLEESYQRREQRLQDETDLIIKQNSEKLKTLETEKADIRAANNRKLSMLETAKNNEIETLKDLHRRAMEQLRHEHEDEMAHLRRLKEQEVSAATSAHAHTKSLQSLMDHVLNSTREVSDLRQKIEVTHKSGLEERELSARARDDYLKQLQERLLRQQSENDEERTRLQGKLRQLLLCDRIRKEKKMKKSCNGRKKLNQDKSKHLNEKGNNFDNKTKEWNILIAYLCMNSNFQ